MLDTQRTEYETVEVLDLQLFTVNSEKPIDATVTPGDLWSFDPLTKDVTITFANGNSVYVAGQHLVGLSRVTRRIKRVKPPAFEVPSGDRSVR